MSAGAINGETCDLASRFGTSATGISTELSSHEVFSYISQLTCGDIDSARGVIEHLQFLSPECRVGLHALLSRTQAIGRAPLFSEVARWVYYSLIDLKEFDFSQADPIAGMPRVLILGPYKCGDPKIGQFLAPPLGAHRIASFLAAMGVHAEVFDLDLYGEDDYREKIQREQFDIIGFSMLQPTIANDIRMMVETAELSPGSYQICGGQGASFNAPFIMEHTDARVVVRGWGEFAMLDLAVYLRDFEQVTQAPPPAHIPSIYFKDSDGRCAESERVSSGIENHELRLVTHLWDPAATPYGDYWKFICGLYNDDHLRVMRTARLTRTVRIYTETHCPMGCDFCSSTFQLGDAVASGRQRVHLLSAEDIVRLIRRVRRCHPEVGSIYFNDDNFFLDKRRVRAVAKLLIEERLHDEMVFFGLSRVDNVDLELLKQIRAAGFYMVIYGVESFSERVLGDMEKKVKRIAGKSQAQLSREAVEMTLEAGLIPRVNLILFYPTVRWEDLSLTIRTATDLIRRGAIVDAFCYVEPYAGSLIVNKGYEIESEWVTFESGGREHQIEVPLRILPQDALVREIAAEALQSKPMWVDEFRNRHRWTQGKLPAPADALVSFYSIMRAARDAGLRDGVTTEAIESGIAELMTMESTPATLLRDDPTNTYFDDQSA